MKESVVETIIRKYIRSNAGSIPPCPTKHQVVKYEGQAFSLQYSLRVLRGKTGLGLLNIGLRTSVSPRICRGFQASGSLEGLGNIKTQNGLLFRSGFYV